HMAIVNSLHAPENVCGSAADGKVTVIWDAVWGATSYKVFRSADGNSFSLLGLSLGDSFTDNSPLDGTNYYRVQALGADNMQSDMSATAMAIVNRLHAPENVRGSAAGGKVTVTWDAVWGATSYNVFRSADGNSFLPLGTSSGTSFTDNEPLPGTNYYYCVQALGAHDMQSGMSAAVHMTIVNRLHTPENVRGSAAGGKVTVTWDAVEGATSYNVFRSADGNSFLPLGTSSGTSFTDNEPLPGMSYYYCVQALRTDGIHSDMSAMLQLIVGGVHDGHEYADLGLPSGIKWATCNVGASSPSDYGDYYAWGETTTKTTYTEYNSTTYGKNFGDILGNPLYDAARANWGGGWRLPSKAEWNELVKECTWTWMSEGDHYGYRVKGPNGNSIFLPAAASRLGSSPYYAESYGSYWSSTPYESNARSAYYLYFYSSSWYMRENRRYDGLVVRPVSE
ncbi:MAG: hypothetical protein K2H04_09070, partial [Bacteroidaceae bacterium]|nr:hypothetical protein [Bacteroidaceae bacterium]